MPGSNGLEVINKILNLLSVQSIKLQTSLPPPRFAIISGYLVPNFRKYLEGKKIEFICKKPLTENDLLKMTDDLNL
jgi:hypothetical protein